MNFLIFLAIQALDIYLWLIIVAVIASWLVSFGVVNMKNRLAYKAVYCLNLVTYPPMAWLRRYIPPVGGLDLTPMVLIFGIMIAQNILYSLL